MKRRVSGWRPLTVAISVVIVGSSCSEGPSGRGVPDRSIRSPWVVLPNAVSGVDGYFKGKRFKQADFDLEYAHTASSEGVLEGVLSSTSWANGSNVISLQTRQPLEEDDAIAPFFFAVGVVEECGMDVAIAVSDESCERFKADFRRAPNDTDRSICSLIVSGGVLALSAEFDPYDCPVFSLKGKAVYVFCIIPMSQSRAMVNVLGSKEENVDEISWGIVSNVNVSRVGEGE